MKNLKRVVSLGAIVLAMGATSLTAFAASEYSTPAELLAAITGRTLNSIVEERVEEDKTYGTIALEAGKLDEFKSEILEIKKDNLAKQVAEGRITQVQADEIIEKIEDNQATCDGSADAQTGRSLGAKFGFNGKGQGNGNGNGRGQGGRGMGGLRLQDGSRYADNNN